MIKIIIWSDQLFIPRILPFPNLLLTLPIVQRRHWEPSLEVVYQITCSFFWSHKRFLTAFFTYVVVLPNTCKFAIMCKMSGAGGEHSWWSKVFVCTCNVCVYRGMGVCVCVLKPGRWYSDVFCVPSGEKLNPASHLLLRHLLSCRYSPPHGCSP